MNIPSVIPSVYTDRSISLVYTNWIMDEIVFIANYQCKLPTKLFVDNSVGFKWISGKGSSQGCCKKERFLK